MSRIEKKSYIHQYIDEIERNEESKSQIRKYFYQNIQICIEAFLFLFGVSRNLVYSSCKKHIREGNKQNEEIITKYLTNLSKLHDFMPDKDEIHLSYHSHKLVYDNFKQYLNENNILNGEIISYSYFNKIWRRYSGNIKARKSIRFSKCGKCTILQEKKMKTNDEKKIKKINRELFNHRSRVEKDRKLYKQIRDEAFINKQSCLSIAIDGADFQRYGLPYFGQIDKDSERGFKIQLKQLDQLFMDMEICFSHFLQIYQVIQTQLFIVYMNVFVK